jgi:catechol 2,3-dioxygenase-like lactoylglutathione lyase family enzyme
MAGFYHVSLVVSDLERAKAFYCDVLGFWPVWRKPGSMRLDQEKLVLMLEEGEPPSALSAEFHFGFRVGHPAHVDLWAAYLRERGFAPERDPGVSGHGMRLLFRDPDGYPVEIFWNEP